MEKPRLKPETPIPKTHQNLSPSCTGRTSNASNSPEFEFWMVRNPSFPQPHLLSADELFVNGVLLPLHLLPQISDPQDSEPKSNPETPSLEPEPEAGPGPESSIAISASKRWRGIFKMGEKKTTATTTSSTANTHEDKDKEKKKERKGGGSASGAELNINIWPFSRSRSAGNRGNRPKLAVGTAATRKVSSAPCSRSNSAGESKSKKWPSSPGRVGVHLGRSSPVWQVRRGGSGVKNSEAVVRNADNGGRKGGLDTRRSKNSNGGGGAGGGGGARPKVLNLNVPTCIGYRHHLTCRSDVNGAGGGGGGGGGRAVGGGGGQNNHGGSSNGGSGANLFNLRNLFSKKVY